MSRTIDQTSGETDTTRYHVPNLDRALIILEFLASEPHGYGVSEIARRVELPKNSVFRIVSTLHAHGYLNRRDSDKTYRLSRKLLSLGYAAIDEHNLIEKSIQVMRELRDACDETTLIGTLIDNQGVVLEQVPSNQPVKVLIKIGHHFPLHTAAPGKAMLAFLPEDQCEAILDKMRLTKFNDRTITSKAKFREELAEVRELGYALDRGEELETLHCVAAPILDHRGHPVAGIWITGPASRLKTEDFERLGKIVMEHVHIISERFGYSLLT